MDDALRAQLEFESRRKSTGLAYVLWFFLGGLGGHRFYLGRTGTAVAQLLLGLLGWLPLGLGWAVLGMWWLVDAFLMPGMVAERNTQEIHRISGSLRPEAQVKPHRLVDPPAETGRQGLDWRSRDPRLDDPIFEKNRRR